MDPAPTLDVVAEAYEMEKPLECDCCDSSGVKLEVYRGSPLPGHRNWKVLCGICAATMVGNYSDYPTQHDNDLLVIMKMIAYVGNEVLKAIAAK